MKRSFKFLCLLLALVTCFSLASCRNPQIIDGPKCGPGPWEFYPEGYTAGFPDEARLWKHGSCAEFWWVETYDECIEAIELLQSHGSNFENATILPDDGDFLDIKYLFVISLSDPTYQTETIQFGDNPFDRCAVGIYVDSYIFLEEVTIDEINYGDIENYNVYYLRTANYKKPEPSLSYDYTYEWTVNDEAQNVCNVYQNDNHCLSIQRLSKNQEDGILLSDECIKLLINSIGKIKTEEDIN